MITITKRLTRFVWYAAPLDLTTAYAWKGNVNRLSKISTAGTGISTNNGTNGFNSYPSLATGDVVELDAKSIPTGGFPIDNGSADEGAAPLLPAPKQYTLEVPLGGELVTVLDDYVVLDFRAQLDVSDVSAGSTVEVSVNDGEFGTVDAANTALLALSQAAVDAGIKLVFRLTRPAVDVAGAATLTVTYQL